MKFKIALEYLDQALKKMKNVIPQRSSIISMQNVLIDATGEKDIVFTGYDGTISVSCKYPAETIEEKGSFSLPFKVLLGASESFAEGFVSFELEKEKEDNKVRVTNNQYSCEITGLPEDEYPAIPKFTESVFYPLNAKNLMDIFEMTSSSAAKEETRLSLTAICLETTKEGVVKGTGTDGHRLAFCERSNEDNKFFMDNKMLLPKKSVEPLMALLETCVDKPCQFSFNNNCLIAKENDDIITMRLIDAEYPNIQEILPSVLNRTHFLRVDRKKVIDAIKFISNFSDQKTSLVRTELAENKLTIRSNNYCSAGVISFDVEYDGDTIQTGLNASYLLEVLKTIQSDSVLVSFASDSEPIVLKPDDEADKTFFIIMPMLL